MWKEARLVLLRKPNKPEHQPSSFRSICLLNEVSKLFERVIAHRLWFHLEEDPESLSEYQYGFRPTRFTIGAIHALKTHVQQVTGRREIAVAMSLDIANVFNSLRGNLYDERFDVSASQRTLFASSTRILMVGVLLM